MQIDILWRRAYSYLFTTLLCFSNPVSNPWRNPWRTVFAKLSSWFIIPSAHRINKERDPAMPVVTACCFWRRIWLIVVFCDNKWHSQPDREFTIWKGIIEPIGKSRPEKGVLGLKGRSSHARAFWTKRTSSYRKETSSRKDIWFPKGCSCSKREFYPKSAV